MNTGARFALVLVNLVVLCVKHHNIVKIQLQLQFFSEKRLNFS